MPHSCPRSALQLQLRVQHATSVNFGYVSYFCGVGVGCGGVGFLPLTLPLLYNDNKSRKAATTTTTETQLGQLSVYIIDRPRFPTSLPPHTLPCPTRRSVCLRDFFLTLVWWPRAHVPDQPQLQSETQTQPNPSPSPSHSVRPICYHWTYRNTERKTLKTVKNRYKIHISTIYVPYIVYIVTNRCSTCILNIYLYISMDSTRNSRYLSWFLSCSRGFIACYSTSSSASFPKYYQLCCDILTDPTGPLFAFPISLATRQAFHLPSISSTQKRNDFLFFSPGFLVNNCHGKQTSMWHMQHAIWQCQIRWH